MDEVVEKVADAIARYGSDITEKGFRELIWPDEWSESEQYGIRSQARAAIKALEAAGWPPVPEKATLEMRKVGFDKVSERCRIDVVYKGMLDVAPKLTDTTERRGPDAGPQP